MQRPEYKEVFAISQSAIKAFKSKTLQKFKKIYIDKEDDDEDNSDYDFGSLVDTLAFEEKLFNERFYIPPHEVSIPGEKVKYIVDKVYKEASGVTRNKMLLNEQGNLPEPLYIPDMHDIREFTELILKYAKENKYGGDSWSSSRIRDGVFENGNHYFAHLGQSNGRIIISAADKIEADEMVKNLRTSPDTAPYFVQQKDETLLFQQEIFIDYPHIDDVKVPLKGALDILRINHKEKWVQIPDLKTTYNSEKFEYIAKRFDYLTQISFYIFLVREWLKTFQGGKCKDYKIKPPINIVIDRSHKIPYIYEYDWVDIEICEFGSKEEDVKGWKETLEDIAWHMKTGQWAKPRELYETGKIKLKFY